MITDHDRNVRTLIVSFVIAIMVLVPLRFYEAGQQEIDSLSEVQVLGASTERVVAPTPTELPLFISPWDK